MIICDSKSFVFYILNILSDIFELSILNLNKI